MTVPAVTDPSMCPQCLAGPVEHRHWMQPSLIRHGGYGATAITRLRYCPRCGHTITVAIETTHPETR